MRLFLSSYGFGKHVERFRDMVGGAGRVVFIDNAKDYLSEDERLAHVEEKRQEFTAAGFEFYELDLRKYFNGDTRGIAMALKGADAVWCSGGNTFLLRRALLYSRLDSLLAKRLRDNDLAYGGSSAGSIIMTPTLRGTENGDDPFVVPEGYKEEIIWNGIGLIRPQLVPHFGSEWFGGEAQAMADYFDTNGLVYETLVDGEVYIVDGEREEKLL